MGIQVSTRKMVRTRRVGIRAGAGARGGSTRKMVRKRAVSRVYTRGMGDLVRVRVRVTVRVRLRLKAVRLDSIGFHWGSGSA